MSVICNIEDVTETVHFILYCFFPNVSYNYLKLQSSEALFQYFLGSDKIIADPQN